MTTFLFEILLGLFWVALAIGLVRWAVSTLKIGAFEVGARHVSRRINPIHFWIVVGWSGVVTAASLVGAAMVFASVTGLTLA